MNFENENRLQLSKTWESPKGFPGWFSVVNQTNIGVRYIFTALIFFLLAGILGLMIRIQLAIPENNLIGPAFYNQIFTIHGITMMFLFAIPMVEGLALYLVPLMIGSRDACFPRLSAFSYYVFSIGGIILWLAFLMGLGPNAGWFNYVPLAAKAYSPEYNIDVYVTVITFIEISALASATELIVTIFKLKRPGLSLALMPPFVWSILVTAFMIVFAMPGVIVGSLLLGLDRLVETAFFIPQLGGDPVLWQHLFWWFGHPDVYIAFIPAVGVVSTIIPVFCGSKLFAPNAVIASIVAIGLISFGLWVHHMFTVGIPIHASTFFSSASALISLPSGILVFSWIATIWGGTPIFKTPFLYCLGFLIIFVIGGLTGFMVAIIPFDLQVHDSYFIVAHFHYVFIGGVVFPFVAALFYWWPKVTGRLLNEFWGKVSFWLTFVGFNFTFFPMHNLGFLGMPRRIYTYFSDLGWNQLNYLSSGGSLILGLGFLTILINALYSFKQGPLAGLNPWKAPTWEWKTSSPPQNHKFDNIEGITGLNPQKREVVVTSIELGIPQGIIVLPGPSLWPFLSALAVAFAFIGSIFHPLGFVIGFFFSFITISGWLWVKKPWTPTDLKENR